MVNSPLPYRSLVRRETSRDIVGVVMPSAASLRREAFRAERADWRRETQNVDGRRQTRRRQTQPSNFDESVFCRLPSTSLQSACTFSLLQISPEMLAEEGFDTPPAVF